MATVHFSEPLLCEHFGDTTCEKNFRGPCYPRHLHCVYERGDLGQHGCRNGGHLKYCKHHSCPSQFKCPDTYCVPTHVVCNGRQDCPNGDDEINCGRLSCPGLLMCRFDDICVHPYDISAGHVKCHRSKDDKALVGYIPCPVLCRCLGHSNLCSHKDTSTDDLKVFLQRKQIVNIRSLQIRNIPLMVTYTIWNEAHYVFLIQLEMSNTRLSLTRNRQFSKLVYLRTLNLSHNSITEIRMDSFSSLRNLHTIDLSGNLITTIKSKLFASNHLMRVLNIRNNALQMLDSCSLWGLQSLVTLDLSRNKIFSVRKDIFCHNTTANLKHLDISENSLHDINIVTLEPLARSLGFLNSTPTSLCCFFPEVRICLPTLTFSVSSSRHLMGSHPIRIFYWVAGTSLLVFILLSISWTIHNIVSVSKKSISHILTLVNTASGCFLVSYFLSTATAGYIFSGKYSFYHEIWRQHPVCVMINALSYTSFTMELFTSCLLAGTRMVAIRFPFKANNMSATPICVACLSLLLLSVAVSALSSLSSAVEPKIVEGKILGLFLLLPLTTNTEHWVWSFATVFLPTGIMIIVLIASNITALHSLQMSLSMIEANALQSRPKRTQTIKIVAVTLICKVRVYFPVLTVHLIALCGYHLGSRATFGVIVLSVFLMHTVSLCFNYGLPCIRQKCLK